MTCGRPKKPLLLTDDEREALIARVNRPKTTQRSALRCRIILACADGIANKDVARMMNVTPTTVGKWRERFRVKRLAGLTDEPRPGAPRKITDSMIREVVTKTLETKPEGAPRWSTRRMAAEVGLSQTAVLRIWRTHGLQPHREMMNGSVDDPAVPLPASFRAGDDRSQDRERILAPQRDHDGV